MRLFVAVEVPADVRGAVAAACAPLRTTATSLRWIDPASWHLTVVFLGSLPDAAVATVTAAMTAACVGAEPFALSLDGRLGAFRGGVLWAGVEPAPQLAWLASRLRVALAEVVALPEDDRPFRAHLTLARAPRGRRVSRALLRAAVPVRSWPIERVVLLRSDAAPGGTRYTEVSAAPLVAAAQP